MRFLRYAMYAVRKAHHLHLKQPRSKGFIGETQVKKNLINEKLVINDIVLGDKKSTQIDYIVINNKGILVIETKNYQGLIKGNSIDKYWIQYINKKQYPFLNPLLQNQYHISCLSHLFPEYVSYFKSIVVFTNNSTLAISKEDNVIQLDQLANYINSLSKVDFSVEKQQIFYSQLLNKKMNM